ncbi:peptide MFS transporter [Dyella nitratireducens]|uniref:MFS transporter n=1 Tax=Dyella nitratireducens TaxID=1849580 RepID=A0ABQ1G0C9_9GAMM|nr:oligopeptide:H+ symporter [Dyella nitratireducens]GGA35008.1 MFS transporter [Dyella nitratireducens]GLQ40943.1 MFS transporter [Dyella nitratireducens]
MTTLTRPVSQTRSFTTVFLIEMWERFGFYGMQVLMVTFMMKKLGFVDTKANLVWGAAAALIYATPAIGGWVGDKLLGTRRTMLMGATILALGYGMLWIPTDNAYVTYISLGVIVVGNGFFKPNAGNLVRKIYEGDETRIDSAFTIYYMAVNIGSMISMTATPWIRNYIGALYGDDLGWHTAFGVCSIGLVLGLINYSMMSRTLSHIGSPSDQRPVDVKRLAAVLLGALATVFIAAFILQSETIARLCVYGAGIVILGIFVHLIRSSQPSERAGLTAALVLTVQTIFFFIFYAQMATSLNLFAQRNVDLSFDIFGFHLFNWIPEQYQNLNAIWIVLLSPVLVFIYNSLGKLGKDPSVATKFAWGFAAVALGFFMYGFGATWAVNGQVSSWVMIWGYGLYSLGELLVSGLGLAMIARYVPERMGGFMMGAYYVAVGISQYLGSVVANIAHIPDNITDPLQSLSIYTHLFNILGFVGIGCTIVAVLILPLMNKLSATHSDAAAGYQPLTAAHGEEFETP